MTIRSALTTTLAALALVAAATASLSPADAVGTADKSARCFGKAATIAGTPGDDVLKGTPGDDVIVAGAGDDRVNGRGGHDLVCGGKGGDRLAGGAGPDSLDGEAGNDSISAGAGSDYCTGGPGTDLCHGGSPGPAEPTPDDPDICAKDVEAKISCRGPGVDGDEAGDGSGGGPGGGPGEEPTCRWPETMTVTMSGRNSHDPAGPFIEITDWSATATVVRTNVFQCSADYVSLPHDTSGTYETHGGTGSCVIGAWGAMTGNDLDTTVTLHPDGTYGMDWLGLGSVPSVWTCPDGDQQRLASVDAGEMVRDLVFDPAQLTGMSGQRTGSFDNDITQTYSWSVVPTS